MTDIKVVSRTQRIIVNPATHSVSVINAGPMGPGGIQGIQGPQGLQGIQGIQGIQGPTGATGPSEAAAVLTTNGDILTRAAGVLARITRANLALDTAFTDKFMQTVVHGSTAGTARSGVAPLFWIGSVDPTNATNNDQLYRTDQTALYVRVAGAWIEVGSTRYAPILQSKFIGSVSVTVADQTGITTIADLTGYAVTFTAVTGRTYRFEYVFNAAQVTAAGFQVFKLFDSSTDLGVVDSSNQVFNLAGISKMVSGYKDVSGLSAGSHTLKLRGSTTAGTMQILSTSGCNGRCSVIDIGL